MSKKDTTGLTRAARRSGTGGRNAVRAARQVARTLPAPQRGYRRTPKVVLQMDGPRDVSCPKCHVLPGERCRSSSGGGLSNEHAARREAYYAAMRAAVAGLESA
jgi:hypothetical protein